MAKSLKIVAYAVNGSGVGHLTRLMAIMRWVRRYGSWARLKPEIYFLSSSEADGLLFSEKFASFKLPSKTIVTEAGLDKQAYLALAKQWVWHSLGLLRPELLVVDTFPRGAFGELLSALDLVRSRGFIYRPMKDSFAERADFQAMLPLYDRIIVPDEPQNASVIVPENVESRVRWVGAITAREKVELLSREEARARLGVPQDAFCVYVTAGGGGDPTATQHLESVVRALKAESSIHLVIGAGPLYRGTPIHGARITWLAGSSAAELMPGFDLAISAAGYNTFFELLQAGVPSLFWPQPKVADEQDLRARRAIDAGAARLLTSLEPGAVLRAVESCREAGWRESASKAALSLRGRNGAREAASRLLELVMTPAEVEAASEAMSDVFLKSASRFGLGVEEMLEVVDAVEPRVEGLGRERAAQAVAMTTSMLDSLSSEGVGLEGAVRVMPQLAKIFARASAVERSRAIAKVVSEFSHFDDWNGASMLLRSFANEKDGAVTPFADALVSFVSSLRDSPSGLYEGMARLSAARGEGREQPSNAELFRALGVGG